MNIFEFAQMLDGRQYRNEITKEEERQAKELGFVVVFGASYELMELRGAINDEVGCFDGEVYVTKNGVLEEDECEFEYEYYQKVKNNAQKIEAIWCGAESDGYTWSYRTSFPHATFSIMDGDEKYCLGIVFNINSLIKNKLVITPIPGEGVNLLSNNYTFKIVGNTDEHGNSLGDANLFLHELSKAMIKSNIKEISFFDNRRGE